MCLIELSNECNDVPAPVTGVRVRISPTISVQGIDPPPPQRPKKTKNPEMSDLVQIPTDANQVTDADEEVWRSRGMFAFHESNEHSQVFLLYTRLAAKPQTRAIVGLGYVDSRSPFLNVKIELDLPADQPAPHNYRRKRSKGTRSQKRNMVIEVELAQDPTSLRSRKGDTGSVLWRVR